MNKSNNRKKDFASKIIIGVLFAFVLGVAIFLRFYHIGKLSFWTDEILTFYHSNVNLITLVKGEYNMILFYFIVHYWMRIFLNNTEATFRTLPAIFSVASIPVVFLLGKEMGSTRKKSIIIGFIASILVTLNAFHIQYAQEFRAYSLVFLLSALSTWLLIKAIESSLKSHNSPNAWWIWYIIVSVLAVYNHYFAVLILFAQTISLSVLYFAYVETFPLKKIAASVIAILLLVLPLAHSAITQGSGGIAWITAPTFNSVLNFLIEITGNQGILLLRLYVFSVSIGLLIGIRTWFKKDLMMKWKFTLLANCLFLPIVITLVFSKLILPIFIDRYLLLVMPYIAVLAAIGIISLVTFGKKNPIIGIITIPIAIIVTISMIALSVSGIKLYFNYFEKEDWRGVDQFLTLNCSAPENLRLYYMPFLESDAMFYNANLKSQINGWDNIANKNPSSDEIIKYIPDGYNTACLTLSHVLSPSQLATQKNIQTALGSKFPNIIVTEFHGATVEIYKM